MVTFNTDPVDYMPLSSLDFEQKNSSTGAIKLAERNNYQLQTLLSERNVYVLLLESVELCP